MLRASTFSVSWTRSVVTAWCAADATLWFRAEYRNNVWTFGESCSAPPLGGLSWNVPEVLIPSGGERATSGLAIVGPWHYETQLLRYPSAMTRRLQRILEFERSGHSAHAPDATVCFHAEPTVDGTLLAVPFHAMDRSLYETILEAFREAGLQRAFVSPDAALAPEVWSRLCPSHKHGALLCEHFRGALQQDAPLAYGLSHGATAEALPLERDDPAAALWRRKTQRRADLIPVLRLWERSGDSGPESVDDHGARNACLLNSWPEELARTALLADPAQGFGGQFRLTPRRPSLAMLTALALVLLHILLFALVLEYREVKREIHAVGTEAVAELRAAWEPLEAQGAWFQRLEAMERMLAEFRETAVPVDELLSLMTRKTPEDTWLRELCITGSQLAITGEAPEALAYRNALAELPPFREVRIVGSVTKGQDQAKEQFSMVIEVDGPALRQYAATKETP